MIAREFARFATMAAAIALALIVYWPALTGPFLFDDLRNLQDLGAAGGVVDWPSLALWMFGGNAGPLGRPLSLASFLLNDYTWPSDPWSFKYTNLLLHAATALLVLWLLEEIAQRLPENERTRGRLAALVAACFWLLHPIHVATVMFAVQRMTILCTFFMVAGAIVWLKGQDMLDRNSLRGSAIMLGSLGLFGGLAAFSKETGVLLPGYLAVIAFTLAPFATSKARLSLLHWTTLVAPFIIAAIYVCARYNDFAAAFAIRDFTPAQRVMSEPLILWSYVREIISPDLRMSLYYDDLVAARSLIDPPAAGIAVLAWVIAIIVAIRLRKREPVLGFAILWFLVGQSLEAGPFSLELKFLHRNYLPSVGPIFAAAYYLMRLQPARLAWALSAAIAGGFAVLTYVNATTWGNEALLVNTWAAQHPGSSRAQQSAASYWLRQRDLPKSLAFIDHAIAAAPMSPALKIQRFYLRCAIDTPPAETWNEIVTTLPRASLDTTTTESLDLLSSAIDTGGCKSARLTDVRDAATALQGNPRYSSPNWQRSLEMVKGNTYALERNLDGAMTHYDLAYAAMPSIQIAQLQAVLLVTAGLYADAIRYLERERDTPPRNYGERIYFDARMRPAVNQQIESLQRRLAASAGSH